jgi:hypothetical protein
MLWKMIHGWLGITYCDMLRKSPHFVQLLPKEVNILSYVNLWLCDIWNIFSILWVAGFKVLALLI